MRKKQPLKKRTSSSSKKRNPFPWIDTILGKQRFLDDSRNITGEDGIIKVTGKGDIDEISKKISSILETNKAQLKIEFQPRGSKKIYILNRPPELVKAKEQIEEGKMRRRLGRFSLGED